ncbi:eosinophil peroxidase-like [Hydractinia symbiolongicarpus]|uniref:eosinophil peroxidase-like n=1 Tax=Hydractinia symbiolongicarpus TaxID=13093 RepID=UPI00254E5175|nr:eosinophil peroxidase-like [Hydractinia symbiolongicarpus]
MFKVLDEDSGNAGLVSQLHMSFGQFLDHDISLTPNAGGCKHPKCHPHSLKDFKYPCFPIKFSSTRDKGCTPFTRSFAVCQKGKAVRQQVNVLTSFIDASMVYSVNEKQLKRLRTMDGSLTFRCCRNNRFHYCCFIIGTGKLKVTNQNLLPFDPLSKAVCTTRGGCFLAGDVRCDEHIALASFHTLFVREHNRIANELKKLNKHWNGLKIFEETRKIVGAILQHITYNEYVPTLATLKPYRGFKQTTDPRVANAFSTAAFRFGHSQIKNHWSQLDANFNKISPDIPLRATYFNNTALIDHGIERTMMGLCGNASERVDTEFASGVAKKLFVPPGKQGFSNLIALNIQRGRDHGLPGYNEYRGICGLEKAKTFFGLRREIPNKSIRIAMQKIYRNVDNHIDLFAAGLAEKHLPGKIVGPTFSCIMKTQFEDLRDGDRYFYNRPGVFTPGQLSEIKRASLARVFCDNLKGIVSIQENVFKVYKPGVKRRVCNEISGINLNVWKENISPPKKYYQQYYRRRVSHYRRRVRHYRRRVSHYRRRSINYRRRATYYRRRVTHQQRRRIYRRRRSYQRHRF